MTKSAKLAIVLSVVLVGWVLSGVSNEPAATATAKTDEQAATPLMKVATKTSNATLTSKKIVLQGQVEPFRTLALKAEVDGRIKALPVELGQRVNKGELLMSQDLKFRVAERAQAKAQIKHRQSLLSASKKLQKNALVAESKVAEDEAELATAKAQLERIEYEIDNSNIVAPFAGVVDQRLVEMGDTLDKGQVVASLVDDSKLKISAMVPQHQLGTLQLGQTVSAKLVNGDIATGLLTFISTTAQEATRSYRVEVLVENSEQHRWVGMSATLTIPVSKVEGHRVKTSIVGLSTEGQLQVKVVDSQSHVQAYPIEIISTETDGLWISGLPQQVELITLGQDFVSAGQQVIGQNETNAKL